MKKHFRKVLFLTLVCFLGWFGLVEAQTSEDRNLEVEFSSEPLFEMENIAPGDEFDGAWVKVRNFADKEKKIGLEAEDLSDCSENCLAEQLVLKAFNDGEEVLSENLAYLYTQSSGVFLSALPAGKEAKYDLKVKFEEEAGDSYQSSSAGFDLTVGAFGEESVGEEQPASDDDSDSGDSVEQDDLIISNEKIEEGSLTENSAVILWETNKESTSRLIYGAQSNVFNLSFPPKYGYQYTTAEYDTGEDKTENHRVEVTGLSPGVTYYYRAVSHASPDTVGREMSFTTRESEEESGTEGETEDDDNEDVTGFLDAIPPGSAESTSSVAGENDEETEETQVEEGSAGEENFVSENEEDKTTVGGKADECRSKLPFWAWILAAAVYAAGLIGNDYYSKRKKYGYRFKSNITWGIIGLIFRYYLDNCNDYFWFVYFVGGGLILSYVFYHLFLSKIPKNKAK